MNADRPLIAATIGDPAGIGPEVCVKAANALRSAPDCDLLLIGDLEVVRQAAAACGVECEFHSVDEPRAAAGQPYVGVLDSRRGAPIDYTTGRPSAGAGHAALEWIRCAERLAAAGRVDGLVMGPINGEALKMTRLVADVDQLQPAGTYMLRVSDSLRVMPITEHVRMREIAATVTQQNVLVAALALHEALTRWGIGQPRIAVAGLNPHAMFEEDTEQIAPAVEALKQQGVAASGPVTPDAVFRRAMSGEFDAVLTMYHDQGQIAIKTAAFSGACTIYVGLEYVQIAIPHGTAYDIAGKGRADASSLAAGIRMAARLAAGSGFASGSSAAASRS